MRIFDRVFGYYRISVSADNVVAAANRCLMANVPVSFRADGSADVPLLRMTDVRRALGEMNFYVGDLCGISGFFFRNRKRYGCIAALAVITALLLLSNFFVWDVRVDGGIVEEQKVIEEVGAAGLRVGMPWRAFRFDAVETALLSASPDIAWVNICRRGNVAYVTVAEKNVHPDKEKPSGYANIVATEDAVIEEILIHKGQESVRVGETVHAGDLLISGILPATSGGGLCRAEGQVRGRVRATVEVEVGAQAADIRTQQRKLTLVRAGFFDFSLNIFKRYGNLPVGCDIIEEQKQVSLFGRYRLPLFLTCRYAVCCETVYRTLTEEEMVRTAALRLEEAVRTRIGEGDLVRIRTEGGFSDGVYRMRAEITFVGDIGRTSDIQTGG